MQLSVVIPVFNEADNVLPLYNAIKNTLEAEPTEFEIVFVDDGSKDGTLPTLCAIAGKDSRVRVVKLRSNFGQTVALREGVEHARGEIIVTMDGDLQNDPRDIPMLVGKIREGYDVVSGWRRERQDKLASRRLPSILANRIIRKITGVAIHDTGCALKAYRTALIRQLPLYSDLHRFVPAMCTLATSRFAEVVVRHHPRRFGHSKYGLSRIGKVLLDMLTVKMLISFSQRPLHWFSILSAPFLGLSMLMTLYCVFLSTFTSGAVTIVPMTLVMLFGFIGVQLLLSGVFAELVIRTEPSRRVSPLTQQLFEEGLGKFLN